MEQILDMPVQSERTMRYAGFWIRVAAYFLDFIVVSIVNYAFAALMFIDSDMPSMESIFMYYGAMISFSLVYFCWMESSVKQGTLGKMAVGIKVGNAAGERITFLNALGRYFAKMLSAIILCIGYMMAGWDEKKQALHDKLAGTYVFYSN